MAASEIEQWWIDKFQENLGPIRKVAGWTTQQLADELGVARQTVSNLETGKSPMTKLQYLALDRRPLPTMPPSLRTVATLPTPPPPRNASPVPQH